MEEATPVTLKQALMEPESPDIAKLKSYLQIRRSVSQPRKSLSATKSQVLGIQDFCNEVIEEESSSEDEQDESPNVR